MLNFVDNFLNYITMYRLILYYLIGLLVIAFGLSFLHFLAFTPLSLIISTIFLVIACWVANTIFAKIFKAQTNLESVYISALILALILTPIKIPHDVIFLGWAALWTIASKYLMTINKKHMFNPVAFGVWITGMGLQHYASWWIGTAWMMPFVLIGGILIVRKIRREDLIFAFFSAAIVTIGLFSLLSGNSVIASLQKSILEAPLFFFAFVMLTEPLTTPPTKQLQMVYGAIVGFLFAPQVQFAGIHTTPESALLLGNIFSYFVSPKTKLFLNLQEKIRLTPDIFDFVFTKSKNFAYSPGQYMEWTLAHPRPDSRGNRRYFTLASSPTEEDVILGVRVEKQRSSYKNTLMNLNVNDEIVASQVAGDFVLPKDKSKKLVFIAGGIGVTPYRSMVKYLIDTNQKRDIVMFYSAKEPSDFPYTEVFNEAQKSLGMHVIYTITDKNTNYPGWNGYVGRVTPEMLEKEVPDYKERTFYLSGPNAMVKSFEKTLKELGLKRKQLKTDYFPGFA